jgi:hypothetical protein
MLRRGLSSLVGLFAAALIALPSASFPAEPCGGRRFKLVSTSDVIDVGTLHSGEHGTATYAFCRNCFGFQAVSGFFRPTSIPTAADYEHLRDDAVFLRFVGFPFLLERREQAGETEPEPVEFGGLRGWARYVSTAPMKIEPSGPKEGGRFVEFYVGNACGVLMGQVLGWPGQPSEANDRALSEIVRSLNVVETTPPARSPPPDEPPTPFTVDDLKQLLQR